CERVFPARRFLHSLGAIFSFISKDAVAKVQIMENYCRGEQREKYVSLQSMVEYELANGLVDVQKRSEHPDSGCRPILGTAATVGCGTLPPRNAFLEIMNVGTPEEAVAMLGEALPYICDVYGITQELFAQHRLLDLP
ncbi:PREDICTED: ceramide-1-phosphate transfer protein, partial [Cariama cristata]|uniref:ceramide-1-phosphate transfer protein n=1 Tax=Cariama cristata TaxID=54380 RepID=UPI0005200C46